MDTVVVVDFPERSGVAAASAALSSGNNDTLAWEQFTTFWVEAATINTHSQVRPLGKPSNFEKT